MKTASLDDPTFCSKPAGALQVVDVARRTKVTPATIRYYARIGLLHPHRDDQNGYRRFRDEDLRRVLFIRKAQALGLTIADIRSLLDRIDHGQPVYDQVAELLESRLEEIRRAAAELAATQARIERVLADWSGGVHGRSGYCLLIEQVHLDTVGAQQAAVAGNG
jgi:DNA-binding transcriptional MerR regulator